MTASGRFCVQPDTRSTFPKVRASQVGGHFAGEDLYAASVAHFTENVIIKRIAATAVNVRQ